MKIFFKLLGILILLISVTSCQFTEKIYLNEDGSGTYALDIDMSAMIKSMKSMGDSTDIKSEKPEVHDTIIYIKDILEEKKDSIAKLSEKEQKELQALENVKIHLKIDETKDILKTDFIVDFKSLNELENIQDKVAKAQSLNDQKESKSSSNTNTRFLYDGHTFHRKVTEKKMTKEEKEAYLKDMEQSASFLDGSAFNIEYHFPRPVKSTTSKDAMFSADKKIMYIKSDMNTVTEDPKKLDFEVILEN